MEYMRPEMVDHDDERRPDAQRPAQEQTREIGSDVTANPTAGGVSQVPPPPPQRGSADGDDSALRDDNLRGRANQADTVDQQRAWQNADKGREQPYSGADPVD